MTKKLYDYDSYATQFEAVVISCQKEGNQYKTVLNQTIFFPEEGGQCCDRGTVNGVEITHVELRGDTIYHYSDTPFEEGVSVSGEIDFKTRFRNMQNHSGEHIICGVAHKLFGCNNVGFHLGADYVTMDLDCYISEDDIKKIELLANEAVIKNMPVTARYPSEDELMELDYRAKGEIDGNVRVVTIGDVDSCACCAPHVKMTGEIGMIKILDAMHYKGGMRLNILCGFDALKDYHKRLEHTMEISSLISVKQDEVADGVRKLLSDMAHLRAKLGEKNKQLAGSIIDKIEYSQNPVCIFLDDADASLLRYAANDAKEKTGAFAVVLSGSDDNGYRYIIISGDSDVGEITRQANTALGGRGGGKGNMTSGTFKSTGEKIKEYFCR